MIERKVSTQTLGDHTYRITALGGLTGSRVFVRVAKAFGPLMKDKLDAALSALQEEDLSYLIDKFLDVSEIQVDGGKFAPLKPLADIYFSANYGELMLWLKANVLLNYGSALKKELFAALFGKAADEESGPKASTDSSGVS